MANGQGSIDEIIGQQAIKQVEDFTVSLKKLTDEMSTALKIANDLNSATGLKSVSAGVAGVDNAIKKTKEYTLTIAAQAVEQSRVRAEMRQTAKEISDTAGAYTNLDAAQQKAAKAARDAGIQFGIQSEQFKKLSATSNEYLGRLKAVDEALGNSRRNVGNYQGAVFSLSQVIRELPAFTYSAQQGFLAIGNNMPILIDQFKILREQVGSTGKAISVFARSIFSFVNVFTILTGLFTIYYKEIMQFMSGLIPATNGQKDFNKAITEGVKAATAQTFELDKLYKKTQDVTKSTEERKKAVDKLQELYPAYFKNIEDENILNGKAKGIYDALRNSIVEVAKVKAVESKIVEIINDDIEKQLSLEEKVRKAKALEAIDRGKLTSTIVGYTPKSVEEADRYRKSQVNDAEVELAVFKDNQNKKLKVFQDFLQRKGDVSLKEDVKLVGDEATKRAAVKSAKEFKFHFIRALENMADDEKLLGSITKETIKALGDAYEAMLPEIYNDIDEEMNRLDKNNLSTKDAAALNTQLMNRESNAERKSREQKEHDERMERYRQWENAIGGVVDALGGLSEAFTARELSAIDTREKRLQEYYDNERRFIEQSGYSASQKSKMQQKLDAETEAKKKQYDRDRITAMRKAATIQKAIDVATIIASTAEAIMAALGMKPYTPANIALAAGAGLTGAAQLARVIATPLPQYAKGRKGGKKEWALVGEAGQEAIVHNGQVELTPNKPTVTLLPEGASVIPNHELIKNAAYVHLAKQGTVTTDKLQAALIESYERNTKELQQIKAVLIDKNFSFTNNELSGYESYRQSKVQ